MCATGYVCWISLQRGKAGLGLDGRGGEPRLELRRERFVAGVGPRPPGVFSRREMVADRAHGVGPRGLPVASTSAVTRTFASRCSGGSERAVGAGRRQRLERRGTRLPTAAMARDHEAAASYVAGPQELGRGGERDLRMRAAGASGLHSTPSSSSVSSGSRPRYGPRWSECSIVPSLTG